MRKSEFTRIQMDREPVKVRERYGMHSLGQNRLLARRTVESGVRFVVVNGWTGQAELRQAWHTSSSSRNTHGGNMGIRADAETEH